MGRESRDLIVDQEECSECGGKAVVCFAPQRNHFFWGCAKFETTGCKGTKAWQKVQVPDNRREEFQKEQKNNKRSDLDAERALTIKAVDRIDAPDGPLLLECSLFPQTEQRRLRRLVHRFFILFYF
jgi:ssDNA-binding Zn-finger/Zn-ribbon topoisomerase 1